MADAQAASRPAARAITVSMMTPELEDVADRHDTYAACALLDGNGELHDFHECRAAELRRFVAAGASARPLGYVAPAPFASMVGSYPDPLSAAIEVSDFELQVLYSWHQARADFYYERDDEPLWGIHRARALELAGARRFHPRTPPWRRWISRDGVFGWLRR